MLLISINVCIILTPFICQDVLASVKYKIVTFGCWLWETLDNGICFFAEVCMVSELEDLSASIDVQDVYTKVKCKIESFNIDHYQSR